MYARHTFAELLPRHRLRDKLRYGVMALCYACHAEQRAFEPRADHSLAHRRAGFIEHPEQRAAFFAVSESLDYFEVAQSRNIEAHEIEFRIERYRRYVFKIVALNFGEIFERRPSAGTAAPVSLSSSSERLSFLKCLSIISALDCGSK